ncbi:hypothetical protein [Lyngbya aestuarii]
MGKLIIESPAGQISTVIFGASVLNWLENDLPQSGYFHKAIDATKTLNP